MGSAVRKEEPGGPEGRSLILGIACVITFKDILLI